MSDTSEGAKKAWKTRRKNHPVGKANSRINYRKRAFERYAPICAICGFGVEAVLEVAHLDCNRKNNEIANLVILCPNCHKMHDLDLIPTRIARAMRSWRKKPNWKKRMKDAGRKAKETRLKNFLSLRALRAVAARRKNRRKSDEQDKFR
jgi:5-methylcytosine-specific restriction endonuclease McrA